MTSRVVIVSNRLPVTVQVDAGQVTLTPSAGGLATGLAGPHRQSQGLWIGWPGPVEGLGEGELAALDRELRAQRLVPVTLSAEEITRYYDGFANGVIWPVFHYLIGQLPMSVPEWDTYEAVNQRFAETIAAVHRPGDLIWIHDYQLMRVPLLLRRLVPNARIGFFLHIPFPSSEVFRILPARRELLDGLLGADLIGFHTSAYLRHFASSLVQVAGYAVDVDHVSFNGRAVRLGVYPMGVDAAQFNAVAEEPEVAKLAQEFRGDPGGQVFLSIDRLDYTKGVRRRLLAYELLLERHPELRGRVRLLMVAVPSRVAVDAYQEFRTSVDTVIGRINGKFATPAWTPVHYMYRSFTQSEVVALYRAADVMLVTPLRDGMNLVAKEFVASRPDGGGVLVLSEFAGAAAELVGALFINPYDISIAADVFHRALCLDAEDQQVRMRMLRTRVMEATVERWVSGFLDTLAAIPQSTNVDGHVPSPGRLVVALERARAARKLILLLDYDGTLVPLAPSPELAIPDKELETLLRRLAARPRSEVHIISGRSRGFLEHWFKGFPIYLHAEHGAESKAPGKDEWQTHFEGNLAWQERVRPLLSEFVQRTPGSFVELKRYGLAWHWRMADPEFGARQAQELTLHLNQLLSNLPVECLVGSRVIEVRPLGAEKGEVVRQLAAANPRNALFMALGDDRTDQDMFAALPPGSIAVQVGSAEALSELRVETVAEARQLLQMLCDPSK